MQVSEVSLDKTSIDECSMANEKNAMLEETPLEIIEFPGETGCEQKRDQTENMCSQNSDSSTSPIVEKVTVY